MNGLGGLNKSGSGVVIGLVQLQLPNVVTPADLAAQTQKIVAMVGQETTVDRGDIIKQEQMPISMMPEGLVMAFSDEQLRNLFAYLMGSSQVPLPAAQ